MAPSSGPARQCDLIPLPDQNSPVCAICVGEEELEYHYVIGRYRPIFISREAPNFTVPLAGL